MSTGFISIKLALLATVVSMGTAITNQGCLDMYVFSSTYTTISNTIQSLEAQVKTLKAQLDATIESACLQPSSGVDTHTRFNLTYCDFEDSHMCNFTNEADTGNVWRPLAATAAISDHTYMGPKGGHMVYSYSTYSRKLTSRTFDRAPAYCIRFYLRAQLPTTKFTVYITEDGGVGYPIYSTAPHTPTTWSLVEIIPDSEYLSKPFKLTFKVLTGGVAYIDDVMVYNAPCTTPGIRKPASCSGKELTIDGKKHCYTVRVEPRTYVDAIRTCKKGWPQSHLLSVTSATVQHYIVNWIRNDTGLTQAGAFGFWTSGQDEFSEGNFVWTTDLETVPFNYTSWHPGQPNNIGGHQNCVLLQYANDNYNWGDVDCGERRPFICESEYS